MEMETQYKRNNKKSQNLEHQITELKMDTKSGHGKKTPDMLQYDSMIKELKAKVAALE